MTALGKEEPRCLAHGLPTDTPGIPSWCDRREACARHVAIRTDPFDGSHFVKPRLCVDGVDCFIPLDRDIQP